MSRPEVGRWCLCLHTEEQALSSESSCHPIREEEYHFPFPESSIAKEAGSFCLPSLSPKLGMALDTLSWWSSRKLH